MDECIKREAAIKAIYDSEPFGVHKYFWWRAMDIEEALRAIPAVDVAPVAHGRWQGTADGYADGELVYDSVIATNTAQKCSARMDGGTDG